MQQEPRVKGQTLRSLMLYLEAELTAEQFARLIESLDAEERPAVAGMILPTSTYPMSLINRLTAEGARQTGRQLPDFARGAGRMAAREGVRGVYRFLVRVLTPESLLGKAASVWSAMNSAGTMSVTRGASRSAIVRLSDYPSEAVMCMRVVGWIEQLAELTGSKNVSVRHSQCVVRGAPSCDWQVTWE